MPEFTQENRYLNLSTPLGKDKLLLCAFDGEEAISGPFRFQLEMLGAPDLDISKLVGAAVTFSAKLPDDTLRSFHGKVLRIAAGVVDSDEGGDFRSFRAEVVPSLSFLKFNSNSRVFQAKTVPQIVEQVCKDGGWSTQDYSLKLKGTYEKLDYCVQYNETDYNFVSRLMEKVGIFYYFDHSDKGHKLVLSDQSSGYAKCIEDQVEFHDRFDIQAPGQIESWERRLEFTTGSFVHRDYNFETPADKLEAKEKTIVKVKGVDRFEVYEFPGGYAKTPAGKTIGTVRMEQLEVAHEVVAGKSTCVSFSPGLKFKLTSHPVKAEANKSYALTVVTHSAVEPTLVLRGRDDEEVAEYTNSFECIPDKTVFRPARDAPLPRIHGLQSAKVVGGKNEEIHADKYGRVKIQFPWDREGKYDDKSSCWVRVAQTWAGAKRGALFTPRVGDEVVVDFIDGDVDRPLIVGSLYNADNMPPFDPKEKGYQSGLKTFSTDKGKEKNFNELRFEDKIGKEQIYFHAERDFVRIVENDDKLKIGFDAKDKGDQTIEIYNNRSVTIDKGNDLLQIKTGKSELQVDKGDHVVTIKQGQQKVDAKQKITLKVGQSQIQITPTDIKITAMKITIDAKMDAKFKGGMNANIEGGIKASLKGGAMAEVKGGIVKIN